MAVLPRIADVGTTSSGNLTILELASLSYHLSDLLSYLYDTDDLGHKRRQGSQADAITASGCSHSGRRD